MTHDEFFELCPFQFTQRYNGWVERDRQAAIKHAQILVTIANANRGDDSQKVVRINDILPWYDDYVGTTEEPVKERFIDTRIPQVDRVIARILESKHLNAAEEIENNTDEYIEAARIAEMLCNQQKALINMKQLGGVVINKANPNEWGTAFPDW
jgi:hypothetical protein